MPIRLFTAALVLASLASAQQPSRVPVVVELFTSEGCSSCPPADALLARLDHDQPIPSAEVIVLSEHVDYWDSLGWPDRFSSRRYTERQSSYGAHFHLPDVFTPQMVVAGRTQFNGADAGAAARAIVQAARAPGLPLPLTDAHREANRITATLTLQTASAPPAAIFAALVSPSETTQVRAGENGGRTLNHAGVVRSLTRVGSTRDLARAPLQLQLDVPSTLQATRVVVFAQADQLGPILGAVAISVPPSHEPTIRAGK